MQKTLFDELEEVSKKPNRFARPIILTNRPLVLTKDDLVPSGEGIIFPCVVARRLPLEERPSHMINCDTCKRIEKELDESIGVIGKNVWYE